MSTQQWIRMIKFICEMSANLSEKEHLLDLVRLCYSQNDEVVAVNASVFSLSMPAQLIWAEYTCIHPCSRTAAMLQNREGSFIWNPLPQKGPNSLLCKLAHLEV